MSYQSTMLSKVGLLVYLSTSAKIQYVIDVLLTILTYVPCMHVLVCPKLSRRGNRPLTPRWPIVSMIPWPLRLGLAVWYHDFMIILYCDVAMAVSNGRQMYTVHESIQYKALSMIQIK